MLQENVKTPMLVRFTANKRRRTDQSDTEQTVVSKKAKSIQVPVGESNKQNNDEAQTVSGILKS